MGGRELPGGDAATACAWIRATPRLAGIATGTVAERCGPSAAVGSGTRTPRDSEAAPSEADAGDPGQEWRPPRRGYPPSVARPEPSPLARALGRLPSGLFVVTTEHAGAPIGFVGSFVQQHGFEPPTVSVGVAKGRDHLAGMRASGRFAVSVLDAPSRRAMPPFFGKLPAGASPFDVVAWSRPGGGCAVLDDALAWLDCRVSGEHELGDHVVVFGEVVAGGLLREGDPLVHLRRDGLGY